jgi:ribosomal protein L24
MNPKFVVGDEIKVKSGKGKGLSGIIAYVYPSCYLGRVKYRVITASNCDIGLFNSSQLTKSTTTT